MHVITHGLEIPVAAPVHDQRLIPAAEQVPKLLVPSIVAAGIGPQQPLHPSYKVGLGRFDDQVKVIAHEAIRMHLPTSLLTRLRERLQQPLLVLVILEDGLPPVAPVHHVINRPRILDAQLPSHAPTLTSPVLLGQENVTFSLTDPFTAATLCNQQSRASHHSENNKRESHRIQLCNPMLAVKLSSRLRRWLIMPRRVRLNLLAPKNASWRQGEVGDEQLGHEQTSDECLHALGSGPNAQHQRWEPAAVDARIGTDLNGWLPSAECCGSAFSSLEVMLPGFGECDHGGD